VTSKNLTIYTALRANGKQKHKIKALAGNEVKVQPKTSESYRTITKVFAEKHVEFHTYKLKEEISYRVVLKYALLHQL
jgi:hypothetical protein